MEFVTILLSALLGVLSPVGWITDEVAETTIRSQLEDAEELIVRIDNMPSYHIVQGRIDRVRIAGRGLYPLEDFRIAGLELESDPIAFSPNLGNLELKAPLQVAIKLVVTEVDINQALRSDRMTDILSDLNLDFAGGDTAEAYDVVNPRFDFLDNERCRLQATLQGQQTGEQTQVFIESGIAITPGQQLRLVAPEARLGEQPIEPQFLDLLVQNISQQAFERLDDSGVTARLLQLEIGNDQLTLASFVRIKPEAFERLGMQ